MACIGEIIVSPGEEYAAGSYWFNWRKNLDPISDTLHSVTVLVLDEADEDVTTTITPAGVILDATAKRTACIMKAFVAGKSYRVFHTIVSHAGQHFTDHIVVHCNAE